MRRRKRNKWIVISVIMLCIIVICTGVFVIYKKSIEKKKEEKKVVFQLNTLPDVTFTYETYPLNNLKGYIETGNVSRNNVTMRESITPVDASRQLNGWINKKAYEINSITYQIRSLDGEKLIEDGTVSIEKKDNETLYWSISLSNLIEEETEYLLELVATTNGGVEIHYYTRLYYETKGNVLALLNHAQDFSNATIQKDSANDLIISALKPNGNMSTTDLSYVNLSSKLDMITWKDVAPTVIGEKNIEITELNSTQMTIRLSYNVEGTNDYTGIYGVEENLCIRFRNNTMYVLNYERNCQETIDLSASNIDNTNINLGIGNNDVQVIFDTKKAFYGIEIEGKIWYYNTAEQKFYKLLDLGEDNEIKLVQIKDNGDMDFIVEGYMNTGKYEGTVGVSVFRYQNETKELTQLFYIPVGYSENFAKFAVGDCVHINENDICYIIIDGNLLEINLSTKEYNIIANKESYSDYKISSEQMLVAWEDGDSSLYPTKVTILDMRTGDEKEIKVNNGEFIHFQGFIATENDKKIDYDVVYSIGNRNDTPIVTGSKQIIPWFALEIANSNLEVETHYEINNIYIKEVQVGEGKVQLERVEKQSGSYGDISSDLLLANQRVESSDTITVQSKVTETKGKEYYINLGVKIPSESTFDVHNTNGNIIESEQLIQVPTENDFLNKNEFYFVFGRGELLQVTKQLSTAIEVAYDTMGVVIDENYNYLFKRDARDLVKEIKIEQQQPVLAEQSLSRCLTIILNAMDENTDNIQSKIEEGMSAYDILKESDSYHILDLSSATLDHLYYYINLDSYILVVTKDGRGLLITGYDSTDTITIYEPESGMTRKITTKEAEELFKEQGSYFLSYIKTKKTS